MLFVLPCRCFISDDDEHGVYDGDDMYDEAGRKKRKAIMPADRYRWPNNTVPYNFLGEFSKSSPWLDKHV